MPPVLQRWLPLTLVALLALGLRVWDLDRRPMHADEANQAVKAGNLLETGRYVFDPADHHGPTLYYAVLPIAWLRGEHTLPDLTETTVRLVPALAGTAAVVLLYFLALPLGCWPALAAAALLAVSPPAVYYSRYFIQETLLVAFTLGALLCGRLWWRGGHLAWAVGVGICAGLMQASKASAPLFLFATLVGLAASGATRPVSSSRRRDGILALSTALIVAGLFYSSFGTNVRGFATALATYADTWGRLATGTGHEKSWLYYLSLFGWQRSGGVVVHQVLFSLLALGGVAAALISAKSALPRWAAGSTGFMFVVLSLVDYKTPWHVIHFVPGLCLLAAGALAALPPGVSGRLLALGLALAAVLSQAQQAHLTSFLRPADERNPYAYVHTSPDVLKLRPLVEAAQARSPGRPVRIISEESWPLPWYLRDVREIGYWTEVPADCDGALVLASAGLADEVRARLRGDYDTTFVGLRPGFVLVVFKPKS
jgi:uncharacterized protein (TIGR03663 family)